MNAKRVLSVLSVVLVLALTLVTAGATPARAERSSNGVWVENPPVVVYGKASPDLGGQEVHVDLMVSTENRDECAPLEPNQVGIFEFHNVSWPGTPAISHVEVKPEWGMGWGPVQVPFVLRGNFPSTAGILWDCAAKSVVITVRNASGDEFGRRVWTSGSSARIDLSSLDNLDKIWRRRIRSR